MSRLRSSLAFGRRCIPAGGVAHRSNILSLSTALKTTFFIAAGDTEFYLDRYFELSGYNRHIDRLRRRWARSTFCRWRHNRVIDNAWDDPVARRLRYRADRTVYSGYFQSECFFKDVIPAVRRSFAIKRQFRIEPRRLLNLRHDAAYVAMHVRLTDYAWGFADSPLGGGDLSLPARYFKKSLAQVPNAADYAVVIVSDDIVKARELIGNHQDYRFCSFEPITDFQILMHADVLITSHSSFSWWAAYLGNAGPIFAPQNWLGFKIGQDYPTGIIPQRWVQVAV